MYIVVFAHNTAPHPNPKKRPAQAKPGDVIVAYDDDEEHLICNDVKKGCPVPIGHALYGVWWRIIHVPGMRKINNGVVSLLARENGNAFDEGGDNIPNRTDLGWATNYRDRGIPLDEITAWYEQKIGRPLQLGEYIVIDNLGDANRELFNKVRTKTRSPRSGIVG